MRRHWHRVNTMRCRAAMTVMRAVVRAPDLTMAATDRRPIRKAET